MRRAGALASDRARPGQPDAEFAQCLKDQACAARAISVPDDAKAAGLIAQCRVEVDRFEGVFASADESDSDAQREAGEAKAQHWRARRDG